MPGKRLSFGRFVVDERAQVLLRDGEPVPIGQRGMRVLLALLSRPGEVLTKNELMQAAWGDASVEESNLTVQIANLRKALGPTAGGGGWIATVPRIGYRFVGPDDATSPATADNRPGIAVLPFENLSGDPEQRYFADGLAEEILTALCRFSRLRVTARNSSFAHREVKDIRRVAADLGVAYVLSGSVRRSGDRLRMSVQLADGATGAQLWADRYDRTTADIFAIQDEVTARIVQALQVTLAPDDEPRAKGGTSDPEALDLMLRARSMLIGPTIGAAMLERVLDLLRRAIKRDPDYSEAHSELALALIFDHVNRWTWNAGSALELAWDAARRAVELAPGSAMAHDYLSIVADFAGDTKTTIREIEAAIAIDPDYPNNHLARGRLCFARGEPLAAVPHFEDGLRRDPSLSSTTLLLQLLGTAYLLGGRHETAAALFRERILLMPDTDWSRAYLASALGYLGRFEEARMVHAELMHLNPAYDLCDRVSRTIHQPTHRELIIEGWRRAGLDPDATG